MSQTMEKENKKGFISQYIGDKALIIHWCRREDSNFHEDNPTRP